MIDLPTLPTFPDGVRYALTVPQSVLFADLSLRGNRSPAFETVFGTAFEVPFIVIDDGAMSWDFSGDEAYCRALLGTTDPILAVRRFISAMGQTARAVEKTSWLVSSPTNRRSSNIDDIQTDLTEYWDAYERHMTSLFTFWNLEAVLSATLTQLLRDAGREEEIRNGLQRFLQPSETNYFALERRHLRRLATRFRSADESDPLKEAALKHHVDTFGFLLAPFNLGAPPSTSSLAERVQEEALISADVSAPLLDGRADFLADLPDELQEIGLLAQEFAFWKSERLDVMSLGDARAAPLYQAAATVLDISTDHLFAMRRTEIETSLQRSAPAVDDNTRNERIAGYCLVLDGGEIAFCAPSHEAGDTSPLGATSERPTELVGIAASSGVVSGPVRILTDLAKIDELQPGDVLVTTMTRPEMGVALDRASAFVTDEGGLMCHAAIIAREMRKPCVIGTGEATKRLTDGLVVTVNGDAGTVEVHDREADT